MFAPLTRVGQETADSRDSARSKGDNCKAVGARLRLRVEEVAGVCKDCCLLCDSLQPLGMRMPCSSTAAQGLCCNKLLREGPELQVLCSKARPAMCRDAFAFAGEGKSSEETGKHTE